VVRLCDQGKIPGGREGPVINGAELPTADAEEVKLVGHMGRKDFEAIQQSEPIQDTKAVWLKQFPPRNRLELGLAFDDGHASTPATENQGQQKTAHSSADNDDIGCFDWIGRPRALIHETVFLFGSSFEG
jgi:hypothetical protein